MAFVLVLVVEVFKFVILEKRLVSNKFTVLSNNLLVLLCVVSMLIVFSIEGDTISDVIFAGDDIIVRIVDGTPKFAVVGMSLSAVECLSRFVVACVIRSTVEGIVIFTVEVVSKFSVCIFSVNMFSVDKVSMFSLEGVSMFAVVGVSRFAVDGAMLFTADGEMVLLTKSANASAVL